MIRCVALAVCLCLATTLAAQEKAPSLDVTVPPGFAVELLRAAQPGEDSWISLTFDPQGRIIVGRDAVGVARITLTGDGTPATYEVLDNTLRHCRGVLYAFDSLYVCATDSKGFYRLQDADGDDRFETVTLLKEMDYRSRYGHGTNQVLLGPDNMLYLINGNDVSFPEGTDPNSPYRDPRNDKLLRNPHDAGEDDRVGHILRVDPEGKQWTAIAGGFRNQFDAAFNSDGELFTYDSDMEWDVGLPWYRPTRLNHVVSGGEYGWRWGTMKWPEDYADSLPTTLDTGLGSPTGMVFGDRSAFPERYQSALFMADWQNGRIYVVDLIPSGSTYRAEYDVFVKGGPLNVCDIEFGPDGALYFVTGGRGSQSGLYRVRWTGQAPPPERPAALASLDEQTLRQAALLRGMRKQLEVFHTERAPVAVDAAWHAIAHEDRWLRFAARVALEHQDVSLWRDRALAEQTALGAPIALLALARAGDAGDLPRILAAVERRPLERDPIESLLGSLRASAVAMIRLGQPDEATRTRFAARLAPLFPHADSRVNRELSELLVALDAPGIVEAILAMLESAATQEEQVHYAMTLRHARGWTLDQRRRLFVWLAAARKLPGGKLVAKTIEDLRSDLVAALPDDDRAALAAELAALQTPLEATIPFVEQPIVKRWTLDTLEHRLGDVASARDRTAGERALAKANCLKCHRLGEKGGQVGPDLSNVGGRFDARTILESILEPSKVIDPKYQDTAYVLTNGKVIVGRPTGVNAKQITLEVDPLRGTSVAIERAEIEEAVPSRVSPMPAGLVDVLTDEEILDLLSLLKYPATP